MKGTGWRGLRYGQAEGLSSVRGQGPKALSSTGPSCRVAPAGQPSSRGTSDTASPSPARHDRSHARAHLSPLLERERAHTGRALAFQFPAASRQPGTTRRPAPHNGGPARCRAYRLDPPKTKHFVFLSALTSGVTHAPEGSGDQA